MIPKERNKKSNDLNVKDDVKNDLFDNQKHSPMRRMPLSISHLNSSFFMPSYKFAIPFIKAYLFFLIIIHSITLHHVFRTKPPKISRNFRLRKKFIYDDNLLFSQSIDFSQNGTQSILWFLHTPTH
jgi:hypothetical protein